MTETGILRRPKPASTVTRTAAATSPTNTASGTCCCFAKLVRKLKKHTSRMLIAPSRQASFQCRYDPLSYSLNFDSSGCGTFSDDRDRDYHQFYAFSSRFVAAPKTACAASH
ncbi:uncharacterized protein LOC127795683 [Diospyros lotus]|uniref:uncharacterized protein LOC127795683 n=1 Tax=Diospyros lotus TaxID=55363 RepID=UPI00224F3244|nr:uncharacterized protein LOC127795683 [Diospyros lotus]